MHMHKSEVLTYNEQGWPLYCVVWQYTFRHAFTGKLVFRDGDEYLHAETAGHARAQFLIANNQKAQAGRLEIVAVAPVVGWHALDDNGDRAVA